MAKGFTTFEIADIARICHEANRALRAAFDGDPDAPSWGDASQDQRESCAAGVRFILDNPDTDDKTSHDRWMERKLRTGWRWGRVKDEANQLHPCLLPYASLPPEQRVKDAVFGAIVRAFSRVKHDADGRTP